MVVRVGIVGCGGMGKNHALAYRNVDGIELVAVADLVEQKAQKLAGEMNVRGYASYEAMFHEENLDLVTVCTPNDKHVEPVVAAAQAGIKGIFCEKPLALNLGDADLMLNACRESGSVLLVDHSIRFEPNYLRALEWTRNGEIGELRLVEWQTFGDQGTFPHNGTHSLDACRFFGGDVEWVMADIDRSLGFESVYATIGFQNGCRGVVISGLTNEYRTWKLNLYGSKGIIHLDGEYVAWEPVTRLWIAERGAFAGLPFGTIVRPVRGETLVNAARHVVSSMQGEAEPISTGEDARAALELITAVYQSVRVNGRVKLPLEIKTSPLEDMVADGTLPPVWARELGRNS